MNNGIAQSKLGTGSVATPGSRPTHGHHTRSFNRICQLALMYTIFLGSPHSPSQTTAQPFIYFCRADVAFFYVTLHSPTPMSPWNVPVILKFCSARAVVVFHMLYDCWMAGLLRSVHITHLVSTYVILFDLISFELSALSIDPVRRGCD